MVIQHSYALILGSLIQNWSKFATPQMFYFLWSEYDRKQKQSLSVLCVYIQFAQTPDFAVHLRFPLGVRLINLIYSHSISYGPHRSFCKRALTSGSVHVFFMLFVTNLFLNGGLKSTLLILCTSAFFHNLRSLGVDLAFTS